MIHILELPIQIDGHNYIRIAAFDDARPEQPYAGTVDVTKIEQAGAFRQLFVYEPYRRQGIASRLLDRVEGLVGAWGYWTCECLCAVDNVPARAFYERRGYFIARQKDGFFEMVLDLGEAMRRR